MPDKLTNKQQKALQKLIKQGEKELALIYEQSILEISLHAAGVKLKNKPFSLKLYPLLEGKITATMDKMRLRIYKQTIKSVKAAWSLSNAGNDQIVDKRLSGKVPKQKARHILYDPNLGAMNAFIDRKEKGMNLSQRVWNLTEPFKHEMEQALGIGLSKGQSAARLATQMKQYLNEPDRLFRRVRSEEGKLVLSKAARAYNPGKGIYRSSYKNALRLTATETNMAYRTADFERWNKLPFVIGIRIKLSDNHPKYDICDPLAGLYPKDFKFVGWHPNCRCHAIPEMVNDEQYDKMEDQLLAGETITLPQKLLVTQPPKSFDQYLNKNIKRIESWKSKPYWVKDNKKYVKK